MKRTAASLAIIAVTLSLSAHPVLSRDLNEAMRGGGRSVVFLDQINKASIVMLSEAGLVSPPVAQRIAAGLGRVIAGERANGVERSADYLDFEPKLIVAVGPDASRLHIGRRRQDMGATIARMSLRVGLLKEQEALIGIRERLLARADQNKETIVPAYTHGVQAQPTTFAHYLLAWEAAFARDSARLQAAFERVIRSPLGAAALGTSSFPIDRKRLADLLGFEGPVENAYDANHIASVDSALEVASALEISAIQLGQFAQDIHAQYAAPAPWLLLTEGRLTGVSSIMPQKRNPAAIEQLRTQSSMMAGEMQTVFLVAHNVRTGMFDYRGYDPVPSERPLQVYGLVQQVLDGMVIDKDRALAEVDADYSTTTEIADTLLRDADVPFRIGHHYASALTNYGRARGLQLKDIPYAEAARLYREDVKQDFPLTEAGFKEAISPAHMVFGSKGLGGPQLAEVARMIAEGRAALGADAAWVKSANDRLNAAGATLDRAIEALALNGGTGSSGR